MVVKQNPSTKLWEYDFKYTDWQGKRKNKRKKGFTLKKDAVKAERKAKLSVSNNNADVGSVMTFEALYEEYKKIYIHKVVDSTYRKTVEITEQRILPYFKNVRLDKINTKSLENWQKEMYSQTKNEGTLLSVETLKKYRTRFSALMNYAVRHGYIDKNPVTLTEPFKRPNSIKKEKSIWSKEEFETFINVVDDTFWNLFFTFLWATGVRIGEAQGVMPKDLNFDNNTVCICRNIDTKKKGVKFIINPPKNKTNRYIELPKSLMDRLKKYCEEKEKIDEWNEQRFLFGFDSPLPNTTIDNYRKKYINLAGVKYISSHCFRHSHATYLLSNGVDVKAVSERMGHKNVMETYNTYAHVIPKSIEQIIKLVETTI